MSYGLRWDAQIEPDPITPPGQVFFAPFIGKPGFPSDGLDSLVEEAVPAAARHRLGSPGKNGKTLVRLGGGIYYARTPGLDLASTRSTNGSVGQSIYRDSTFNGFGLTPPAYDQLVPNASNLPPDHPQVYVTDKNFTNPRTYTWALTVEQALTDTMKFTAAFTYAKGVHGSRFVDRNDPVFGSPWSTGLGADKTNGIGQLTTLESSAKSLFRGLTLGMQKQLSQHFQFQMNYQLSEDLADDDNERDPFSYRYAVANNFKPDYGFSDRMERHRFNAFGLWQAPWGIEFSPLISYPFAAADFGGEPRTGQRLHRQAQHAMEGQQFLRVRFPRHKNFKLSERFTLQAIVDAFNLTNSANPKHPETTSLLFNFDGTVQSGLGDPRQAQLGLRLMF